MQAVLPNLFDELNEEIGRPIIFKQGEVTQQFIFLE